MDTEKAPHAWKMAHYNTAKLRKAGNDLREEISNIIVTNGRSEIDRVQMAAIEGLAVAADHIDRLENNRAPHIVQISSNVNDGNLYMFGIDPIGRLWEYDIEEQGWMPLSNEIIQTSLEETH